MRFIIESIASEFHRSRSLAERAMEQLPDEALSRVGSESGNSVATIARHLGGNLASRFTEFLTTDGEKTWRQRDDEFTDRIVPRDELMTHWVAGWSKLESTLESLRDDDLTRQITIRAVPLTVAEALHRCLAHVAYHVGQIVQLARASRGSDWQFLSIPPGGTAEYNKKPTMEKPRG